MNTSYRKTLMFSYLSLTFALLLVLSNLVLSSKLIPTGFFSFTIPGGLILYPLTFLISDIVNELFGPKKARVMVFSAFIANLLASSIVQIFMFFPVVSPEIQTAWHCLFDLSPLRFLASLLAFIISQQLDIVLYSFLKNRTSSSLWLRSNGSTWISQIPDTFIVDTCILYFGMRLPFSQTLNIMFYSYIYKIIFCVFTTPLFYLAVNKIRKFLGITSQQIANTAHLINHL
ncbi:queuosine precursor transporter [Candidatus Chlamydia corallus]|uniref:queuosine precursor transporter n=1 Tax=Candidatus Chlamydia corallus TaxID=2038470 RepID=UPI000C2FDA95|nr:queuosine precursor transporter [Candidatus Chlamydia corallus]